MTEYIQNIFAGFCEFIQYLVCLGVQVLAIEFTDDTFSPNLSTFTSDEHGIMTATMFDNWLNAFLNVGFVLAIALFFIHLVLYWKNIVSDVQSTIAEMFARIVFTIIMVYGVTAFFDYIMTFANSIYDTYIASDLVNDLTLTGSGIANALGSYITDPIDIFANEKFSGLQDAFAGMTVVFAVFNMILQIVFFGIALYNFGKLCLEMIKRYFTMVFLYILSPVGVSFFSTAETQMVTASYAKMFGVTVGVLIFTRLWVILSLYIMATLNCTFTNMCIMIAVMQFGVFLEGYARELGLTTSSMGGALLNTVAASGTGMLLAAKGASNMAGNALVNAGGALSNMALTSIGSALSGKPMSFESRTKAMNDSVGAAIRKSSTKSNNSSNMTKSQAAMMNEAIDKDGLFRNATLSNTLGNLNAAGHSEAMNEIMNGSLSPVKDALTQNGGSVLGLNYSQNNGLEFLYRSPNGSTRGGFISDSPKSGSGLSSTPVKLGNGHTAYINMNPVSMQDIHDSGISAYYNSPGDVMGNGTSTMELDTGLQLGQFVTNGDTNATNYAAVPNNTGGVDIRYNSDGVNSVNLNNSSIVGAITKDGYNLKTSSYQWGNNQTSPQNDIYNTLTNGAWSNVGFKDVEANTIKLDSSTGEIQFMATDVMTHQRNTYTAMPSVSVQDKVTKSNTVTDSTLGSYTFSKHSNH